MEKLSQLRARADEDGSWDLIVVDTPPSRSALDCLDAPQRLGLFLDGRFIRLLTAPAKAGGRAYLKVFSAGIGLVTHTMTKLLGAHLLRDVQTFVAALDTMFGGFRERADATYRLLQASGTSFLVVAAPERDALREASFFVDRLSQDRMPLSGLVLNRVHPAGSTPISAQRALAAAETLAGDKQHALTAQLLRLHAERDLVSEREAALAERFTAAHPDVPVVRVPARAEDVHDLDGLREIGSGLGS
jgi:anion-transporting  ArsA/GET3 family ATPase